MAKIRATYLTEYTELPETAAFNDLPLTRAEGNRGYVERGGLWQVLLACGVFYSAPLGSELARKCRPEEMLDKNLI